MEQYNWFQRFMQKFGATRFGAWFGARFWHYFDLAVFKLSGKRMTLTSIIFGLPMVMLTTTGAKSGLKRTTPLAAIRAQTGTDCFALIASNWGQDHHPGWYHNLKANPQATATIKGVSREYRAYEANGEEYDDYWQRASQIYFGYRLYKKRVGDRRIPIMVLEAEQQTRL